jgi:hypothetical protein
MMGKGVAYEVKEKEEMTLSDFKEDNLKVVPLVSVASWNMNGKIHSKISYFYPTLTYLLINFLIKFDFLSHVIFLGFFK